MVQREVFFKGEKPFSKGFSPQKFTPFLNIIKVGEFLEIIVFSEEILFVWYNIIKTINNS